MSGIKDTATVTLNVNGAQAKKMMAELETQIRDTEKAISDMNAAGADPKAIQAKRKQLGEYKKQLNELQSATEGVNRALYNLDKATPRELEKSLRTLNKQLKDMTPGTEVWQSHVNKIKELKERLSEIKEEISEQKSLWQRFMDWSVGAWPALDLLDQWGSGLFDVMRGAVDAFAGMDQEMANVRKFTGMTAEQVADLNEEFKQMDTRTSREDLNKLAQEAGRLGKTSKEDVIGFVRAADQINVALDDLGEGATLTLSKLTGVFGDEARYGTEQSLLKVGSVINELSQNCSASAPYLAQFASRMGGVGAQAKITIPQIMAFGAVLDSNGQAVEASSTALSQVIVRMMQEPAKYAKVAGLDVQKFTDMLKTDVNGALILFLETLQKAGGMDTLSPMFKDMGENGSRAIAALSTLATHIEDVKDQQIVANKAFAEGTSVTTEFNVQNTTVQASIEKAKKAINDLRVELGERLSPLMSHLFSSSSAIIRALVTIVRFVMDNKTAIFSLAAGIAAYNVAVNIAAIKTAIWTAASKWLNVALAAERMAIIAVTGVVSLLSGNITRATAAFKLFSMAIKANPIGLAVSLISAAAVAIGSWINKANEARKAEQELARQRQQQAREFRKQVSDISKTSGDYAKTELDRLKKLYDATQDQTKSQKERIAAAKELQRTYPTAFSNLSQEQILAGNAASAYDTLARNIIKAARAKAAAEKIKDNEKQLLDLNLEREDVENSIREDSSALDRAIANRKSLGRRISNKRKFSLTGPTSSERRQLAAASSAVQNLNDNLDASSERLEEIIMQSGELERANSRLAKIAGDPSKIAPDVNFSGPEVSTPLGPGYESQTQADKEAKKKAEEARREDAKAKREFKAQIDAYKAQRSSADREVLELYKAGSIDYEELLRRRHENELKYYDSSLDHFEKVFADQKDTYLQDDKDYQKLLLDREKSDEKYEQNRISLALDSINRRKAAEEKNAQHMYDVKSDPTIQDEINLQSELYRIRKEALVETQALYNVGSKEYADAQYQIEALETEKEMTLKKTYFKAVSALRKEYDKKSAGEKYELEKSALDALLAAESLTAEQYAAYLEGLTQKYKKELPGESDSRYSWSEKEQMQYDKDKKELADALSSNLITQADYYRRLANLDSEARKQMLKGLKEYGGEWNSMLSDVFTSFSDLMSNIQSSPQNFLGSLSDCVAAVSAVIGAGMQMATEFAKAESQIQLNAIEKRYDREIELAQGNTYKVAKLEKKKEAEIRKIKSEAAQKEFAMKVLMGIAQTAQNALMAYSAGLSFPFPANTIMPPILAGIAVAQGAVQVALLKKQQQAAEAQGYSKGGFTKPGAVDEPAGIVHAGEWVASQKLLANPVARPMIEALDYAQRTNTIGSLRAEDVSRSIRANDSLARIAEDDGSAALVVAAVAQNAQAVNALVGRLNEPFVTVNTVTGDHGYRRAENEYDRLINNKSPKSRRNGSNN